MKLEVIKMFADNIAQFGTVDILVNNAGLQRDAKFVDMTLEQWNFVLAVNLTGQFLCAREAIKGFMRIGIDEKKEQSRRKNILIPAFVFHGIFVASQSFHRSDHDCRSCQV